MFVLFAGAPPAVDAAAQQPAPASIPAARFAPPQPAAECPVSAAAAIAEIPDDVDLVLVVENGTDIRASALGDAAGKFLTESGVVGEVSKAWSALASELGWPATETFDRLLGRRVVLLSRSVPPLNDRRWTVLSDVSVETETRLKERLQAAPRAIVQGHQILSIENGAYELTSHHHGAGAAGGKGGRKPSPDDRATVLLSPAGKGDLFDQMLATLSRAGNGAAGGAGAAGKVAANNGAIGTMSSHEIFTLACQAGPTEVLLMAALDPTPGEGAGGGGGGGGGDRWKNFVMLAGRREADGAAEGNAKPDGLSWKSRVIVRQTGKRDELLRVAPSSDAAFRALSADSVVAMVQRWPLPAVLGPWAPSLANVLSVVPIPEDAKKQLTPGEALRVRVAPGGRVSCTLARQTESTEALARTLDPAISANVQRIEQQFGVAAPAPQNYGGLAPNAVRTTTLACSEQGGFTMFSSRPVAVSWAYPSMPAVNGPANLADASIRNVAFAAPFVGDKRPGWWVLNLAQKSDGKPGETKAAPTAGELLRSDANALLTVDPQAEAARWVWQAHVRPAALEGLLPSLVPDANGLRSGMRRFDSVDVGLRITEQGDVQGDVGFRLVPEAGK